MIPVPDQGKVQIHRADQALRVLEIDFESPWQLAERQIIRISNEETQLLEVTGEDRNQAILARVRHCRDGDDLHVHLVLPM